MSKQQKAFLSLYVYNRSGVLARITLLFTKFNYNIDSLVVSSSQDPQYSWISIEASGDSAIINLMTKQLHKLIDVIHIRIHNHQDQTIEQELALFKIAGKIESRKEILQIADTFYCRILDISERTMTVQATGTSQELNMIQTLLKPYGLIDCVRTGKVFIEREPNTLTDSSN